MKRCLLFLIIPFLFMFSISVFSKNNFKDFERYFDPERPWAGKYRVTADKSPFAAPLLATTCSTQSKPVVTDDVEYPIYRISYYAYAGVHSLRDSNEGHYSIDVEVPFKASTMLEYRYDGKHFDYQMRYSTNDVFMGGPNIDVCKANAKINENNGNSSESDIPMVNEED